ncbi:DUF3558 family protein [Nocardia sp. NPDC127526]|uniref:DUF3558 family protein n=1 Tax=Nocardia sp. NPDC127526 TaxID=3345393 RepID=UPI003634AC8B
MTRMPESCATPLRRGIQGRTTAHRLAAVLGVAAIALTACATDSTGGAPAPGGTTSVKSTPGAPTTVQDDSGAAAPDPTEADTGTTAPGSPAASAVDSPAGTSWDPCSLPESDLAAAGLDTSTETRVSGSKYPACTWQSTDGTFETTIVASGDSMDAVLEPGTFHDLRRTEYYGRQMVVFRSVADSNQLGCHIATPAGSGSIVFTVRRAKAGTANACHDVQRVGAALFNSLP